jgi:hypothetical protein
VEEKAGGCERLDWVKRDCYGDPGSEVLLIECTLSGDSEHKLGVRVQEV